LNRPNSDTRNDLRDLYTNLLGRLARLTELRLESSLKLMTVWEK
jgi:hypothetical protein